MTNSNIVSAITSTVKTTIQTGKHLEQPSMKMQLTWAQQSPAKQQAKSKRKDKEVEEEAQII